MECGSLPVDSGGWQLASARKDCIKKIGGGGFSKELFRNPSGVGFWLLGFQMPPNPRCLEAH